MPCLIAPACPEKPPPETLTFTSNDPAVFVNTSGWSKNAFADPTLK